MNTDKLKEAEARFLERYPGGLQHPDMLKIGKKHKMERMISLAQEQFSQDRFAYPGEILEQMVKAVSRSSMVSMFEKPRFRDFVAEITGPERRQLSDALSAQLYGKKEVGFQTLVSLLQTGKLAKWSLITIIPNYVFPDTEVFVKPTTAKGVIRHFELGNLEYKPLPTWDFYHRYQDQILQMKAQVDPALAPNNAAFCGFLMMTMK